MSLLVPSACSPAFLLLHPMGALRGGGTERKLFVQLPPGAVLRIVADGPISGTLEVADGAELYTVFATDLVERSEVVKTDAAPGLTTDRRFSAFGGTAPRAGSEAGGVRQQML